MTHDFDNEATDTALTDADRRLLRSLRQRGWAVTVFSPAELGWIDQADMQAHLVQAGEQLLHQHSPYDTSEVQ